VLRRKKKEKKQQEAEGGRRWHACSVRWILDLFWGEMIFLGEGRVSKDEKAGGRATMKTDFGAQFSGVVAGWGSSGSVGARLRADDTGYKSNPKIQTRKYKTQATPRVYLKITGYNSDLTSM
jgi:hypothetical protein